MIIFLDGDVIEYDIFLHEFNIANDENSTLLLDD
jgi:hypothetical protein